MTISQAENAKRLIAGATSWAFGTRSAHSLNYGQKAEDAYEAFEYVVSETNRARNAKYQTDDEQVRAAYSLGCWMKGFAATSEDVHGSSKVQMESWAAKLMELQPALPEKTFKPVEVFFTALDGTVKNIHDFSFMIPKNLVTEHK